MGTEPFIGEITLFAGSYAPQGWAFCHGQLLPIQQFTALFSLLGTTYGGDGRTNFALPDLRGRVAVGFGQGPGLPIVYQGEMAGEPWHTLSVPEMPAHTHPAQAMGVNAAGNSGSPGGNVPADSTTGDSAYSNAAPDAPMAAGSISVGAAGGSRPHNNMQPYLGLNYIIALAGTYPTRE